MERYRICSVFGHTEIEITEKLENNVLSTFEDLIKQGYRYFFFGGFGMFDDLCYRVVSALKKKYPYIERIFCLYDQKQENVSKRPQWLKNEEYEQYIYLNVKFDWWYKRIYFRNCAIIDQSDVVVFLR